MLTGRYWPTFRSVILYSSPGAKWTRKVIKSCWSFGNYFPANKEEHPARSKSSTASLLRTSNIAKYLLQRKIFQINDARKSESNVFRHYTVYSHNFKVFEETNCSYYTTGCVFHVPSIKKRCNFFFLKETNKCTWVYIRTSTCKGCSFKKMLQYVGYLNFHFSCRTNMIILSASKDKSMKPNTFCGK